MGTLQATKACTGDWPCWTAAPVKWLDDQLEKAGWDLGVWTQVCVCVYVYHAWRRVDVSKGKTLPRTSLYGSSLRCVDNNLH